MVYILIVIVGLAALTCADEIGDSVWDKIGA